MLVSVNIENFKSLHKTHIEFSELTLIVGANAYGKSSILQAIDFLTRSAERDFSDFLEKRNYEVSDIVSKFTSDQENRIRFVSDWDLDVNGVRRSLHWEQTIVCSVDENTMQLESEQIFDRETDRPLLDFKGVRSRDSVALDRDALLIYDVNGEKIRSYPAMTMGSSCIKIAVDTESKNDQQIMPELIALKKFLMTSRSYDLLSPAEMRQSSRGVAKSIGSSGRDLPAYIKNLSETARTALRDRLNSFIGDIVENVDTRSESRAGWTRIETLEKYGNNRVIISSKNMSDGTLRLLAFLSILQSDEGPCLKLLDEIENGIGINCAEKLLHLVSDVTRRKDRQIIATTHSTVFMDYVEAKNIVLVRRNRETGLTETVKMLDIPGMEQRLEYLFPGEVLLNMSDRERTELKLADEESSDTETVGEEISDMNSSETEAEHTGACGS